MRETEDRTFAPTLQGVQLYGKVVKRSHYLIGLISYVGPRNLADTYGYNRAIPINPWETPSTQWRHWVKRVERRRDYPVLAPAGDLVLQAVRPPKFKYYDARGPLWTHPLGTTAFILLVEGGITQDNSGKLVLGPAVVRLNDMT